MKEKLSVSELDEAIVIKNKSYALATNQFPGVVHPKGFQYLIEFKKDIFPEFIFQVDSVKLKKTIATINWRNKTIIIFEVLEGLDEFELQLSPFIAMRDFHSLRKADNNLQAQYSFQDNVLRFKFNNHSSTLYASINKGKFISKQEWYYNFEYLRELERGLDFREDLFNP